MDQSEKTSCYELRTQKKEIGIEDIELVKTFAVTVVTKPRLEQRWEYLREMGAERTRKGAGTFLKWLNGDIEVEEKDEIEQLGVDKGLLNKQVVYNWKGVVFQAGWSSRGLSSEGNVGCGAVSK